MYEELVSRLRWCASYDPRIVIQDCNAAADAIEELQAQLMYSNDAAKAIADKMPKWIPVTERLPQEWCPVLGLIQYYDKEASPSQMVLWYLGNGHWRETWRGDMIESDVTHWMPLPQPPKEE